MKRSLMGLIVLLLSVNLSACQGDGQVSIPLLIYDQDDLFMQSFEQSLISEAEAYPYSFEVYDAEGSQLIQNNQFKAIVESEPPLILINPVDRVGVYPLIELAEQAGIKLVFFNREPLSEDIMQSRNAYYVGSEASQSAVIQFALIDALLTERSLDTNEDGAIQTLILKGQPGHQDAEIRTANIIDLLESSPTAFDIIDTEVAFFDRLEAFQRLTQRLASDAFHVELIVSNNDAMALGAIDALENAGYFIDSDTGEMYANTHPLWLPVVGIDGIDLAIQSIDQGMLHGTVLHNTDLMSAVITELIDSLLKDSQEMLVDNYPLVNGRYIYVDYAAYSDD